MIEIEKFKGDFKEAFKKAKELYKEFTWNEPDKIIKDVKIPLPTFVDKNGKVVDIKEKVMGLTPVFYLQGIIVAVVYLLNRGDGEKLYIHFTKGTYGVPLLLGDPYDRMKHFLSYGALGKATERGYEG